MVEVSREPYVPWFRTKLTFNRLLEDEEQIRIVLCRDTFDLKPNVTIMDKFPRSLIARLAPTLTSQITPAKKKEKPLLVLKDINRDIAVVLFKWMIAHCKGEDKLPKVAEPTLPNYIKLADAAEEAGVATLAATINDHIDKRLHGKTVIGGFEAKKVLEVCGIGHWARPMLEDQFVTMIVGGKMDLTSATFIVVNDADKGFGSAVKAKVARKQGKKRGAEPMEKDSEPKKANLETPAPRTAGFSLLGSLLHDIKHKEGYRHELP